ncbi:L-ascorbate peroxidase 3 [Irineochytrium annulatum]|nr:L-ascorbate peroxidase 3 [Irineochytrium annulatum]
MKFNPISSHGANNGLGIARELLAPIGAKYPAISTADLWQLAGKVAIEYGARGTNYKIPFRAGRKDAPEGVHTPDGRLPDATKGSDHLRHIFHRMGLNDQDIVALSGAHSLGRMHADRSGFEGPWVSDPTRFSNAYFVDLLNGAWEPVVDARGNHLFNDKSKGTAMVATDMALLADPIFRTYVNKYAADQGAFFADFAVSFQKLQELGCQDLTPVDV